MPSTSANGSSRRRSSLRLLTRGVCLVTVGGLVLGAVPAPVSASPVVLNAPLMPSIVGVREGARGNDVKTVQTALLAAGVKVPGGADGVFGPATRSAVTAFQSRNGLAPSGEIDAPTAAALGLEQAPAASAGPAGGLVVGARGENVAELQRALMATGVYVPGGADGVFGQATKTAVSNFQRWNGLPVTGEVDATTSSRLKLGTGTVPTATPTTPTAAAPGGTTSLAGMTIGARGENVKVLQRALIAAGITVRGGADGVFGPVTASALKTYQQSKGLSATGVLDDATVAALSLATAAPAAPAAPTTPAPAPAATANPYEGMTVGARGDLVKELQRALMSTGIALRGGADGVFGNATKGALILFQKTNGTAQTGVLTAQEATTLGLGGAPASATPQGVSSPAGYPVYGERGARVTSLQKSLIAAGISFAGGADGVFGAATAGAIMEFQRRSGLTPTGKVDEGTAARLGSAPAPAPAPPSTAGVTIDVFPVQGKCWFGDTWQAPRGGGRLHEGVDIIAAKGNLLYAAVSGTVSKMYWDFPGALAGNGLRIQQDNGTYFTYLHLDTFAEDIEVGTTVTAGQVIGTVGNTGNSATPHLHFEVHPGGGAAVNPYPLIKPLDACHVTAPRA